MLTHFILPALYYVVEHFIIRREKIAASAMEAEAELTLVSGKT